MAASDGAPALAEAVQRAHSRVAGLGEGRVATYIPQLRELPVQPDAGHTQGVPLVTQRDARVRVRRLFLAGGQLEGDGRCVGRRGVSLGLVRFRHRILLRARLPDPLEGAQQFLAEGAGPEGRGAVQDAVLALYGFR